MNSEIACQVHTEQLRKHWRADLANELAQKGFRNGHVLPQVSPTPSPEPVTGAAAGIAFEIVLER